MERKSRYQMLLTLLLVACSGCGCDRRPLGTPTAIVVNGPVAPAKAAMQTAMPARLRDPYGSVTPEQLRAFEKQLGHELPTDYRAFLLQHNGGDFRDCETPDGTVVEVLYGIETGYDWSDLEESRMNTSEWIPPTHLAIACGPGSNQFCLGLTGEDRGKMFIVYSFSPHDPPEEIAASFTEFMEKLVTKVPEGEFRNADPAFDAIDRDDMNELKRQLGSGTKVELSNDDGKTLLMHAVWQCRLEIVELLLKQGADIKARDKRGHSAIFYAVYAQSPSGLRLVVEHGADVNELDDKGSSPLVLAVEYGYVRSVQSLLELGADPNYRPPDGKSILSRSENDREYIRPMLLKAGAKE